MEPITLRGGRKVPGDAISVSFTRDLGSDSGPDAARAIPSTVELRIDLRRWDALPKVIKERLLAHPDLSRDTKGTVRLQCGQHASRGMNLEAAQSFMTQCIQEAIDDRVPVPEEEPTPTRRGGAGLIKSNRTRRRSN
jgi:hypothetical protein